MAQDSQAKQRKAIDKILQLVDIRSNAMLEMLRRPVNSKAIQEAENGVSILLKTAEENINAVSLQAIKDEDDEIFELTIELHKKIQDFRGRIGEAVHTWHKQNEAISDLSSVQTPEVYASSSNSASPSMKLLGEVPSWNGKAEDFRSWRLQTEDYFKASGVTREEQKLVLLRGKGVLPRAAAIGTRSCRTEEDFWKVLEERFTFQEARMAVVGLLRFSKPIDNVTSKEVLRVLDIVSEFIMKAEDLGLKDELNSQSILCDIADLIGDDLFDEFISWMDSRHEGETWKVKHCEMFLNSKLKRLSMKSMNKTRTMKRWSESRGQGRGGYGGAEDRGSVEKKDGVPSRALPFLTMNPPEKRAYPKQIVSKPRVNATAATGSSSESSDSEGGEKEDPHLEVELEDIKLTGEVPAHFYDLNSQTSASKLEPFHEVTLMGTRGCKVGRNIKVPTHLPVTVAKLEDSDGLKNSIVTLLDHGSDLTLISEKAVKSLGLQVGSKRFLRYKVVGGNKIETEVKPVVLTILTTDGRKCQIEALMIKNLGSTARFLGLDFFDVHPHLKSIESKIPFQGEPIELLIGYEHKELMDAYDFLKGSGKSPIAAKSLIGWTLYDRSKAKFLEGDVEPRVNASQVESDFAIRDDLTSSFEKWAKGEVLGVEASNECRCKPSEIEEAHFFSHMKRTIKRTSEGRLEVSLPWKPGFPERFKNNRVAALAFLRNLERTLYLKGVKAEYETEMARIIKEYAEPVPDSELDRKSAWYLQHFLVENKTKLRIVWNSAAVFGGVSLNEGLEKGPNLLNDLVEVLLRFRKHPIAIQADVAKMFNQVQISEKDRDYHRFVWEGLDYRWTRLPFGDKPAPDLSVYCLQHLAEEAKQVYPLGAMSLKQNTYVDDILVSCEDFEKAELAAGEVESVLERGCFEIKGWHSNIKDLETAEPCDETGVLGMQWHKETDELRISKPIIDSQRLRTRREVLSALAKVWDPLGISAPLMVEPKVKMQSLWDTTISWDDPLSEAEHEAWVSRFESVQAGLDVALLRPLVKIDENTVLHGFCDASDQAYGAVFWLSNGKKSSFVMAKTLVAPLKIKTIPRLELLAAQLAVRMYSAITKALGELKTIIWSDSEVVIHWIRTGSKKYKAFVSARIQEIFEKLPSAKETFLHIDGSSNPADWLTKPLCDPSRLEHWLEGPDFIRKPVTEWPFGLSNKPEEEVLEVKKDKTKKPHKKRKGKSVQKTPPDLHFHHVASEMSIDSIAEICKTWDELRQKVKLENESEELLERRLFKAAQTELCDELYFEDSNGLKRKVGRLLRSDLPDHMKTPVVLDGKSQIARLWYKNLHETTSHRGARFLKNFAYTERGVVVTGETKFVKRIVNCCEACKKIRGAPHTPMMGQLPKERLLSRQAPFSAVGVDFVGPFILKESNLDVQRYVLLFTCLTSRVCHLEVTNGMSSEDVVKAWRRFAAKRGILPSYVLSDRAKAFKKSKVYIERLFVEGSPHNQCQKSFVWEYTHPRAPHRRGVIESLVKSLKNGLDHALSEVSTPQLSDWHDSVNEINFLMNSRPLIDETDDPCVLPITGNWLLHPYQRYEEAVSVNGMIVSANSLVKLFWDEWMSNVPRKLLEFQKWSTNKPNVEIGNKVLVIKPGYGNHASPRKYWPEGIVKKCFESEDGVVRKVLVELQNGKVENHVVQNLIILSDLKEDFKQKL